MNLVTAHGLAQIEATIARLTEEQRIARDAGDVPAAASAARDLRYWTARLATAQLTEQKPSSQVQFGSRVTIKRPDGSTRAYRIVGTDEANPVQGTLSYVSPLAQASDGQRDWGHGCRQWTRTRNCRSGLNHHAVSMIGRVCGR